MLEDVYRARLPEVLFDAVRAPCYRDRLPKLSRFEEKSWAKIPFTTKADLRAAYPFGLLAVPRDTLATYHESSGTSGEPTSSYFTEADWDDVAERFARSAVDLSTADTVLVKTPYSLLTTAHQMHRAARLKGALVVPADNRSSLMPYAKVVRLLHDLPVTVAWCLPTEPLFWAEAARLQGRNPARDFPSFRAFLVAGEAMSPAKRRRLAEIWGGKRVVEDYGSTETGSLGGECARGRLHLWADRLYFELYDPQTCGVSRYGEGQLVVTTLYREAMPLVRYFLEDTVRIESTPCGCGSDLPVARVLGRTSTRALVQGQEIFPSQLEEAVFALPAERGVAFWRARFDESELEIELEIEPDESETAIRELTERIELEMGVFSRVRAVPPGTIVPRELLTAQKEFSKPRFLFARNENWNHAIYY